MSVYIFCMITIIIMIFMRMKIYVLVWTGTHSHVVKKSFCGFLMYSTNMTIFFRGVQNFTWVFKHELELRKRGQTEQKNTGGLCLIYYLPKVCYICWRKVGFAFLLSYNNEKQFPWYHSVSRTLLFINKIDFLLFWSFFVLVCNNNQFRSHKLCIF